MVNTKYRSDESEIMDNFSIKGLQLRDTLDKLTSINKWLGGNKVTLNGLEKLLRNHPKDKTLVIVDLGCGDGDMLRRVADYGKRNGYAFNLLGIDANEDTINYAANLSGQYPEINYLCVDIFSDQFKKMNYDVVLTTLFLHHFKEETLIDFMPSLLNKASLGLVVNDLHRHWMAYYSFKLLSLGIKNKMVKRDGLTSILRGFKRTELEQLSKVLKVKSQIRWKWAFRYQWIINK